MFVNSQSSVLFQIHPLTVSCWLLSPRLPGRLGEVIVGGLDGERDCYYATLEFTQVSQLRESSTLSTVLLESATMRPWRENGSLRFLRLKSQL